MFNALDIAEYFICLAARCDESFLTNLKVQKLLYYAQGYALALCSARLFGERIVAWQLGPVVVEVYREFERYGSSPIPVSTKFDVSKIDKETMELLDRVYSELGGYSAAELVDMTHEEPPWKVTKINKEISAKHLQDYFRMRLS